MLSQINKYHINDKKGGIEIVSSQIADLIKIDHDIYFGEEKKLSNQLRIYKVLFTFLSQPVSMGYLRDVLKVSKTSNKIIIHLPNPLPLLILTFAIYLFRKSKPKIFLFWHADTPMLAKPMAYLLSVLNRYSELKICVTSYEYLQSSRQLKNYEDLVKIIPLAIKKRPFQNEKRGLNSNEPLKIIIIGRLVRYKGIIEFLEALEYQQINADVKICGRGPLAQKISNKIKITKYPSIELLQDVSDLQKLALLEESDLLVLPSNTRQEAFGVVLIEALERGLPIAVNSDNKGSGMLEVCKDGYNGFHFTLSHLKTLINRYRSKSNNDLNTLRLAAREDFEKRFSTETFDRNIREWLEI